MCIDSRYSDLQKPMFNTQESIVLLCLNPSGTKTLKVEGCICEKSRLIRLWSLAAIAIRNAVLSSVSPSASFSRYQRMVLTNETSHVSKSARTAAESAPGL